ncbi:MAG: hypothetical protein EPN40_04625 [Rhodanobacteraceae bacterium]|nr:MAG: hypothetical protein EPN40_04625 [Rhodanobacteraceae bacterium]
MNAAAKLAIVPDDAAALLDLLAPGEPLTFQTFDDKHKPKDRHPKSADVQRTPGRSTVLLRARIGGGAYAQCAPRRCVRRFLHKGRRKGFVEKYTRARRSAGGCG